MIFQWTLMIFNNESTTGTASSLFQSAATLASSVPWPLVNSLTKPLCRSSAGVEPRRP